MGVSLGVYMGIAGGVLFELLGYLVLEVVACIPSGVSVVSKAVRLERCPLP